jgi:peptide synthetase PhsB
VAEDSFFALGGNSLLAARATARTRKAAGVRLELTLLLEHPVFADYVARVDLVSRAEETA